LEVIPSIDIRDGYCVRLYQGDYSQETVFSDDPLQVALRWQSLGAPRLHVIDLDGAVEGKPANMDIINTIAGAILVPTQLGGGIRDIATVKELLRAGIERVILGTAAVEDTEMVKEVCGKYADSVIVSIDTRDGLVAVRGWTEETELDGVEFAWKMAELGVKRFIYTDIVRDGTLTEPNFTAISELITELNLPVIAAGGIASLQHLIMLRQLGAEGAIVGRALYTGDIDLKQALAAVG
jgi:phosphoribosylformimino-5-aminoimidazole carboxamide ribotide isomerase